MANITLIQFSERKSAPWHAVPEGLLLKDWGLEGDAHAGTGHRQVSLLGKESIPKIERLSVEGLCTGRFNENITTEGICLYEFPVGTRFSIGLCELEITQVGKECFRQCPIYNNAGDCSLSGEVVFARVNEGGLIQPGDELRVINNSNETDSV